MSEITHIFKTITWELLTGKCNKKTNNNVDDKFWWVDKLKVKPYIFPHKSTCMVITGFTKKTILTLIDDEDQPLILGINYSPNPKLIGQINLFFLAPETIKKAYIDAGVPLRACNDLWHVTMLLADDNKSLRLTRKSSDDFFVELNNRNFYQKLEIPEDRIKELLELIPAKQTSKIKNAVEKK